MQMDLIPVARNPDFRPGDSVVVLYQGLYNGMAGNFVGLAEDPKWADVRELDGTVHAHPLVWLRHADDAGNPISSSDVRTTA